MVNIGDQNSIVDSIIITVLYIINMKFDLTNALIDEILFFMEDQEGSFSLDTVEGIVTGGLDGLDPLDDDFEDDDGEDGERYIDLPDWDSSDGFRLMERYAAGLRNPVIREELSSALSRGKGVFRAFKDTLSRHPEAEKLWFSFKEKEMKREIIRWYNGLREEWGLEQIGSEPEETDDLVLEDFRFRAFQEEDIFQAEELHRQCLEECENDITETGLVAGTVTDAVLKETFTYRNMPGTSSPAVKKGLVAESGNGELAGYISAFLRDSALYIQVLEVKAEYRGLGIGETLFKKLLESLNSNKVDQVLFDLPSRAEGFSRVLLRESFKPYVTRYCLNHKTNDDI
jgi:ribosomal protein S18 acetylase RimI-like enzyme